MGVFACETSLFWIFSVVCVEVIRDVIALRRSIVRPMQRFWLSIDIIGGTWRAFVTNSGRKRERGIYVRAMYDPKLAERLTWISCRAHRVARTISRQWINYVHLFILLVVSVCWHSALMLPVPDVSALASLNNDKCAHILRMWRLGAPHASRRIVNSEWLLVLLYCIMHRFFSHSTLPNAATSVLVCRGVAMTRPYDISAIHKFAN